MFNQPSAVAIGQWRHLRCRRPRRRHNARIVKFNRDGNLSKLGERKVRDRANSIVRMRWHSIPRAALRRRPLQQPAYRSSIRHELHRSVDAVQPAERLFIDQNDVMYVSDSESREKDGYGHHPGWKRGIRVGSAKDGSVSRLFRIPYPTPEASATSGAEGVRGGCFGAIYGAEVGEKDIKKYVKK